MAHALELKFTKEGYDVICAQNGEEALAAMGKTSFDVILLDLMMPVLDGFGVLNGMKEKKINVPVIITSNLSQAEDIKKTKELGAVEFLVKSNVTLNDIVETVVRVLK